MYLIRPDYFATIQDQNLTQICAGFPGALSRAEAAAVAEAKSFLVQKYDVDSEFKDLTPWAYTEPYSAGDRVYLDASVYDATQTYNKKDLILKDSQILRCNADNTTGAYDATKWDAIGFQYDIFYGAYPYPLYDSTKFYNVGDNVYWQGNTYTAIKATSVYSHVVQLQFSDIERIPQPNIRPDFDFNQDVWKNNGAYLIAADNDIELENIWTPGDPRDQQMVQKIVSIALFHLHKRISPQNIPLHIAHAYKGDPNDTIVNGSDVVYPVYSALGWLQSIARGKITAALEKLQPNKGGRISYGGAVKKVNDY